MREVNLNKEELEYVYDLMIRALISDAMKMSILNKLIKQRELV